MSEIEESNDEEVQEEKPKSSISRFFKFVSGQQKDEEKKATPKKQEKKLKAGFLSFIRNNWKSADEGGVFERFGTMYRDYRGMKETEGEKLQTYEAIDFSARLSKEFLVLLAGSCIIATFGLFQGSTAVIIGAMIIAPLMMPILGLALGTIWGDQRLLWRSIFTLLIGSLLALIVSSQLTVLIPELQLNKEIIARFTPNLYDIMIALFSGLVGAYACVNPNISSSVSGVAIAVALMPPLCTIGIGIGLAEKKLIFDSVAISWYKIQEVFIGSTLLYLTNLVGISLAASIVFWRLRIHPVSLDTEEVANRAKRNVYLTTILLLLIAIPLGFFMVDAFSLKKNKALVQKRIAKIPKSALIRLTVKKVDDHIKVDGVVAAPRAEIERHEVFLNNDIKKIFNNKVSIHIEMLPRSSTPKKRAAVISELHKVEGVEVINLELLQEGEFFQIHGIIAAPEQVIKKQRQEIEENLTALFKVKPKIQLLYSTAEYLIKN